MDHRVPVDLVHPPEGHVAGNTGVIHQYVHWTDLRRHLADAGLTGFPVGHIAGIGVEVKLPRSHRLQPLPRLDVAWRVGRYDGVAERRQFDANRFT